MSDLLKILLLMPAFISASESKNGQDGSQSQVKIGILPIQSGAKLRSPADLQLKTIDVPFSGETIAGSVGIKVSYTPVVADRISKEVGGKELGEWLKGRWVNPLFESTHDEDTEQLSCIASRIDKNKKLIKMGSYKVIQLKNSKDEYILAVRDESPISGSLELRLLLVKAKEDINDIYELKIDPTSATTDECIELAIGFHLAAIGGLIPSRVDSVTWDNDHGSLCSKELLARIKKSLETSDRSFALNTISDTITITSKEIKEQGSLGADSRIMNIRALDPDSKMKTTFAKVSIGDETKKETTRQIQIYLPEGVLNQIFASVDEKIISDLIGKELDELISSIEINNFKINNGADNVTKFSFLIGLDETNLMQAFVNKFLFENYELNNQKDKFISKEGKSLINEISIEKLVKDPKGNIGDGDQAMILEIAVDQSGKRSARLMLNGSLISSIKAEGFDAAAAKEKYWHIELSKKILKGELKPEGDIRAVRLNTALITKGLL